MQHNNKGDILKKIIYYFLIFGIISIITLYAANSILPKNLENIYLKQLFFYLICLIFILKFKNNEIIYKNIRFIYIIGVLLLIYLILFGTPINNARCWIKIPFIGSFQPSEFMKITLVIYNAIILSSKTSKKFFKISLITIIPCILTYLEPDTGLVLIYLLSIFIMLFVYLKKTKYLMYLIILATITLTTIILLYYLNQNILIKIFGNSIFLRVERLINWQKQDGYQLNNALIAMGSSGLLSFFNINVYYPESHTDFIFATFASAFGFIPSVILLIIILLFDLYLLNICKNTKNECDKLIITGFIAILIYQQIQNIGMNLGLLPITGITLPFISYGGSSLLSYSIMLTIIKNTKKEKHSFSKPRNH